MFPASGGREAARLFGAAAALRERVGAVRFKVWDSGYEAAATALRDALGEQDFDAAWAEGAALSTEGGDRLRPTRPRSTQTTQQRMGVPHAVRTRRRPSRQRKTGQQRHRRKAFRVTTHCADPPDSRIHQLGLTSRVQLVQEAARHG